MDSAASLQSVPIVVGKYELPKAATLNYEKIFSKVDNDTAVQLKKITEVRYEVVIASERSFAEAAIKGVNRYLPSLFGLMNAVEQLPSEFTRNLEIIWTSGLRPSYGHRPEKHSNWYFEVIHVMQTFALLHRKQALERLSELTPDAFLTRFKEVIDLLAIASGIFQYIADYAVPKFFVTTKELMIPEIFSETFSAFSSICLAEQQEILVKQACLKKFHHIVAAKLSMGASVRQIDAVLGPHWASPIVPPQSQYEAALRCFKNVQSQSPTSRYRYIDQPIEDYVQWKKSLTEAQAYKFMALHHIDTERMESKKGAEGAFSPGLALAYMEQANKIMATVAFAPSQTDSNMLVLLPILKKFKEEIAAMLAEYNKDNASVYHEPVRHEDMVPIEAKMMAKMTRFEPPPAFELKIIQKDNGYFCCIS